MYNCIIVGSGIAAMQLANHLNNKSRVLVITKSTRRASNSYRAQGGIAAAIGKEDTPFFHYEDTIKAGCDYHNEQEVRVLVENGPALIEQLKNAGLPFDKDEIGQLALGMEGAHSRKRIVHCGGDATGKHMMEHLIASIRPTIDVIENRFVYELMIHPDSKKCIGIKAKDPDGNNEVYFSDNVVLAVGGIGGLFSYTSNDSSVAGDGVALAYRAGAEITDMEFIQFHPTLLYINGKTAGLVSEAVRGEGARLIDQSGIALMKGKHLLEDLAPRHIVAKEIFHQRATGNDVYLDISTIHQFEEKFPTITALCSVNGISIESGKIPVAPGCHFLMGGIAVNSVGQTSIDGLYAIGETAATGVHGANRLASNSLLEGLYYGKKLAVHLNEQIDMNETGVTSFYPIKTSSLNIPVFPNKEEIQEKMMAYAGIIRTHSELELLKKWLSEYDYPSFMANSFDEWSIDNIQKLFMLQTAKLVVNAALLREESRGAHNRKDFSMENKRWGQLHIVQSKKGIEMRERQREHTEIEIYA
ncbi:L-aspartate oxidase [Psychrobacillus soli]|uniref:L-aspartate oxidase n=1 Tax=Psychrobacillus soli TaxID=1543965 RepID=A0A544TK29_9BACI|nr:L-aspartate oxidase [Psychrobacillus soli]TQR17817.1 L-aspartate oxidase [Psychrobacillus soli]